MGETTPAEASEASLAAMMVGRAVILQVDKQPPHPREVVLKISNLRVYDDRQILAVDGVDLEVRAGETLGIAGVQGNGQTELVAAIAGLRPLAAGTIEVLGQQIGGNPPRTITEMGVAHVPEDRQRDGIVKVYPLTDNSVLETYYQPPFAQWIVRQEQSVTRHAEQLVRDFDVRTPSVHVHASALSGGNQQKLIIAREFTRPIKLLIAAQPTRGVDVGSIEFIHKQIVRKRDEGCAVLLVSAELDEILALSDRIAVMYHGKIIAVLEASAATREQIGLLMAGGQHPARGELTTPAPHAI